MESVLGTSGEKHVWFMRRWGHRAELEMILNAGLFHDLVCHVPRFYFTINGKCVVIYQAEPYSMVAFAVALKTASVFV